MLFAGKTSAMNTLGKSQSVTILVPVYNEEDAVLQTIERIQESLGQSPFPEFELIVINDGSTDSTQEKLKDTGVRVITHLSNLGYGASLKSGLRAAGGNIVVITDADGTYPVDRIPDLLAHMEHSDMVVGARSHKLPAASRFRTIPRMLLKRFAAYLVGMPIPDLNSGFRAFRRDLVMKYFRIIPSGFSFTSTITMALMSDGYQVTFMPIDYFPRLGRSKIRPVKDTIAFFSLIIRTSLYFSPLKVFVPLSGFFFALACLKVIFDILYMPLGRFIISQSVLFLTLLSIQVFVLGLVADLIIRRSHGD